jgi:hypothetical protein
LVECLQINHEGVADVGSQLTGSSGSHPC